MRHFLSGMVGLVLCVSSETLSAQEQKVFDLRAGADSGKLFRPFGPDAGSLLQADDMGLRIMLPASRPQTGLVGAEVPCGLQGDFEVVLGYELLAIGEPVTSAGCGVQLRLLFGTPVQKTALMTRMRKNMGKEIVETVAGYAIDGDEKDRANWRGSHVVANSSKGKLRVVRTGPLVAFSVADGPMDFVPVWSGEMGTELVSAVKLAASSGFRPTPVDVRFTDLTVQAAALIDRPAPAAALPEDAARAPRPLLIVGIVVAAIVFAGVLVVVLAFLRRKEETPGGAPRMKRGR